MTPFRIRLALVLAGSLIPLLVILLAQPGGDEAKTAKAAATPAPVVIEPAAVAVKKLAVAPGLQVDVWASEPLLKNPVAFCFDERGRAFVVETARRRSSVPDIRRHDTWRGENLGLRSVEERMAFLQGKYSGPGKKLKDIDLADLNGDGQRD